MAERRENDPGHRGLGFTGRHVIERLTGAGYRVVSYNRDFATADGAVIFAQGELFDVGRLTRVMRDNGVSAVVHTAALSHPTLSIDFPVATFAANVDGTLGVLEAMRLAGVTRLVNFSSETMAIIAGALVAVQVTLSGRMQTTTGSPGLSAPMSHGVGGALAPFNPVR